MSTLESAPDAPAAVVTRRPGRARGTRTRPRIDWLTWTALGALALLALAAVSHVVLDFSGATEVGQGDRLAGTGSGWAVLGTDHLGRALLPRIIGAIGVSFAIALPPAIIAALVASVIACLCAYTGGVVDLVFSRIVDVLFTFPAILLALLLVSLIGPSTVGALVSIALIVSPQVFRVIRSRAKEIVPREFVRAARVSGASVPRVVFVHVLPNVAGAVIVQMTFAMVLGILVESSLSFLGLGVTPPAASLGSLVRDGSPYLTLQPILVFAPAAVLAAVIFSINVAGDWLRDALEVREVADLR